MGTKPKRAEPARRIQKLALKVCEAVVDLTRHRRGRGEQRVMLTSVRREFAARTLLVVVSLMTGLVLLELGCRLSDWLSGDSVDWVIHDSLLGFVPRPDSTSPSGSFNRDGFRVVSGTTSHAGLVVATGDSFVMGDEVADDEAWPAVLQQLTGVRVINAGVSAYALDQTVLRTEQLAAALAPTMMVVSFIADDTWRAEMRRLWRSEKPYFAVGDDGELVLHNVPVPPETEVPSPEMLIPATPATASLLQRLLRRSALAQVALARLAAFDDWLAWHDEQRAGAVRALPRGSGERVSCALMHRLAGAGVPVLVVAQYDLSFWIRGPAHQAEERRQSQIVLECASAAGLRTLDTFEKLAEAVARGGLRSLYLEDHHSAYGNKLMARSIGEALATGGMLGPSLKRQ